MGSVLARGISASVTPLEPSRIRPAARAEMIPYLTVLPQIERQQTEVTIHGHQIETRISFKMHANQQNWDGSLRPADPRAT